MPREHFGPDHQFLPRSELLTFEEITFFVSSLLPLGLQKVRLTGGEPLLRSEIVQLIGMLRALDNNLDIAMTTNGALLEKYAQHLVDAGLNRVTVSLDAIDTEVFAAMSDTLSCTPQDILNGIDKALEVGLGVKMNAVIRRGINDAQILKLAKQAQQRGIPLRFVEFMDVGNTNQWDFSEVVTGAEIKEVLESEYGRLDSVSHQGKHDVARQFKSTTLGVEFGFINSVSAPFCGDCSRARLSAHGSIYTCLFATQGHDLRSILRMNASQEDIRAAVTSIWTKRTDQYSVERHLKEGTTSKVEMSFIGG